MTDNNQNVSLTPNSIIGAECSVKIAQLAFDRINQIISEIREDLTAERKGIPINVNKIKTEIRNKQQELIQRQRKDDYLKKMAKQHKGKIAEWKQLYKEVPVEKKEAEKENIMSEIKHRAAEIKIIEEKIGRKLPKETEINLNIILLNMKLEVCQLEKSEGPIDKDPRMLALWQQQKAASDFLINMRAELETLKKQMRGSK